MPIKVQRRLISVLIVPLLLCLAAVSVAQTAQAAASDQARDVDVFKQLPQLDSDYQALLNTYLQKNSSNGTTPSISSFSALVAAVQQAPDTIAGSALLRNNLALLLDNLAQPDFSDMLQYLYQANDTATIKTITEHINKLPDPVVASQNYFLLAQYYYQRSNWEGVRAALSKVNLKDLADGDGHYYDLLMGYALQALKEHRKAVLYYKNIPQASPYYSYAKLNQGTAFLRQGWWSEAHMELEQAVAHADQADDADLHDRLLVVMAYSQLNYEFYRDARKTLRRVAIDGAYTNKALMGLGLAAAYQEDFAGAINAFRLLAQKQPADLSVDEGQLLHAYAAVELGDKSRAEIAYQSAIEHYQNKITMLNQLLRELERSSIVSVSQLVAGLDQRAAEIYASDKLIPQYFLDNYQGLATMRNSAPSSVVANDLRQLQQRYQNQLKTMVSTNINLRESMLQSYLSQAKYGKAKLYDE